MPGITLETSLSRTLLMKESIYERTKILFCIYIVYDI